MYNQVLQESQNLVAGAKSIAYEAGTTMANMPDCSNAINNAVHYVIIRKRAELTARIKCLEDKIRDANDEIHSWHDVWSKSPQSLRGE